jgi:hypothetical protein
MRRKIRPSLRWRKPDLRPRRLNKVQRQRRGERQRLLNATANSPCSCTIRVCFLTFIQESGMFYNLWTDGTNLFFSVFAGLAHKTCSHDVTASAGKYVPSWVILSLRPSSQAPSARPPEGRRNRLKAPCETCYNSGILL